MWQSMIRRLAHASLAIAALSCIGARADTLPLDGERIAMIDAYALATPASAESTPTALVQYLSQPARTDTEKARVIFRWVTDRISYDVDAYFSNNLTKMSAENVLQRRRSICDGYAALFERLAHEAGMEAVSISGYAKAYGHVPGTHFDRPNHTWNAIKIDGQWRLIDTTWGAGYVRNGKYVKVLTETFFLPTPEQMIFTHLPADDAWQLQSTPRLTKAQFEAMPDVEPAFFHLGIAGKEAWQQMSAPGFSGFVRTYDLPYHLAIVEHAPLSYKLHMEETQHFAIQSDNFEQMAIVQNNQWTALTKDGPVFTSDFTAHGGGDLLVVGKRPGMTNFTAILGYRVTD